MFSVGIIDRSEKVRLGVTQTGGRQQVSIVREGIVPVDRVREER